MGKKKIGGYEVFLRDTFHQMRRNGQNPNYNSLFQSLNGPWKSLTEEQRLEYKERAKSGDANPRPNRPPSQPRPQTHPAPSQPADQDVEMGDAGLSSQGMPDYFDGPSTSSGYTGDDQPKVKTNISPLKKAFESKPHVDSKPVIKEERGVKRKLEVDLFDGQQNDDQQRRDHEQHEPPKKKGFAVPNWKNIKNSTQPEADRYFDYHLVELRNKCESIVSTHIDRLMTFPLYTFSCNVLCKYKKDGQDSKPKYVPLEIAINAYTIKDGQLGKPYHVLIDSGKPPTNYWCDTYDHMLATHKIKVTQDGQYPPGARNDCRNIYKEMNKYVRGGERTILVADNYDLEQVRSCIEWVYEMAAVDNDTLPKPGTWTILPLVDFVAAAYNHIYCHMLHYPLPKFTLHYFLKVRLETSLWDYEVSLMCDYHKKDQNQTKWCAQNCAIRAFKAIELTLEEMLQNYKLAANVPKPEPQPTPASTNGANAGAKPARPRVQQMQQPLHMPEDKDPPPIIEEVARREELKKQQEELARQQFPPPPYYEGYYEIPKSPTLTSTSNESAEPPLAIKPPDLEMMSKLDPRLKRKECQT